eukprot:jgi/Bigna1/134975/aug1.27_g9683
MAGSAFDAIAFQIALRHACGDAYPPPTNVNYRGTQGMEPKIIPNSHRRQQDETRIDPTDGKRYTLLEFEAFYSSRDQWEENAFSSSHLVDELKLIDPADGKRYSRAEFQYFYNGSDAEWQRAYERYIEENSPSSNTINKTEWGKSDFDEEDKDGKSDENISLSNELLEILYQQRIRRSEKKKRKEREQLKKLYSIEDQGLEEEENRYMKYADGQVSRIGMLEAELDRKFDNVLDSVGYKIPFWPAAPLNA